MPNANIVMKRGLSANLSSQNIVDGTIYVTTDEGAMYVDVGNSRIRLGDFVPVETLAALQNMTAISEKAMYYVKEGNILARYDATNSRWIQINKAGIVNVNVTGSGNAVSNVSTSIDQYGQLTLEVTKTTIEGGSGSGGGTDPQVYEDISNLQAAVRLLNGTSAQNGSVAKAVADAKAALLGSPTTYMTIEALETALADVKTTADAASALATANQTSIGTLTVDLTAAQSDITSLQSTIGSSDSNGLRKRIKDLETALALLNNSDATVQGSVKYAVAQGVAEIVAGADARYDTLKEIADWILSDTTGAAALAIQVNEHETDISNLKSRMTTAEGKLATLMADANTEGSIAYQLAAEATARSTEDTRLAGLINTNSQAITQLETDVTNIRGTLTWREF